jgi:hypothetical protein
LTFFNGETCFENPYANTLVHTVPDLDKERP